MAKSCVYAHNPQRWINVYMVKQPNNKDKGYDDMKWIKGYRRVNRENKWLFIYHTYLSSFRSDYYYI
jgi:hypothetical protein